MCLRVAKEEVCKKSGFPHWFSLLLMALRFGALFGEKSLNSVRKLFIEFFHLYFMSLHLSISPFRINTLNPWVAKSWTRLID